MSTEQDYTSIRVNTLRGDLQIPFDVYVRVAGKYILYCRNGSTFEGERLDRLKAKKLKAMFVRKEDEIPYRQYLESSIDSAFDGGSGKSDQTRAEVIQGFLQSAAEQYLDDPVNQFAYDHMLSAVDRFTKFLPKEAKMVPALLKLSNNDKSITHHGSNVATLATAMAQAEVKDPKLITTTALGCLIHDIEHFVSNLEVAGPPASFPDDLMKKYKAHPVEGASRLQGAKFVDRLVLNIISQHEEHIDGSGFPKGLREKDMDPLVMMVATANAYDRLVHFEHLDPKTALKTLFLEKLGAFPLKALQRLQVVLKDHGIV